MLSKPITFFVHIKVLSDKENNLLRNEKWGVCQNINKFISGVDGSVKAVMMSRVSCLTTVNDAFNSAADLLSFIDNKRKNLYTEKHTSKPFASDELKYFRKLKSELRRYTKSFRKSPISSQQPSWAWRGSFHVTWGRIANREEKKKQKKAEKNKEKRLHQQAYMLLKKRTSK